MRMLRRSPTPAIPPSRMIPRPDRMDPLHAQWPKRRRTSLVVSGSLPYLCTRRHTRTIITTDTNLVTLWQAVLLLQTTFHLIRIGFVSIGDFSGPHSLAMSCYTRKTVRFARRDTAPSESEKTFIADEQY